MKREQVLAIFPEATTEQVDAIMKALNGEVDQYRQSAAKAADIQDQLNASRRRESELSTQLSEAQLKAQQGMSAEEQLAELQRQAEEQRRDFVMKTNALDARQAFVAAGCFDDDTIDALVAQVTVEDADVTKASAKTIVELVAAQRKATEESVRDELLKSNPAPKGQGGATQKLNWADVKNMSLAEQMKLKAEQPEAFSQMMKSV